jgi:chloramphenicol-sensitive protein RarD
MSETAKGVAAMIATSLIWGLSPIYYKALAHVPPLEVLSHRTLWSFLLFSLVLMVQGRFGMLLRAIVRPRTVLLIAAAGLMISINWFTFILSVQIDRSVEASLGYYIFPLVAVAIGFFVFKERLSRAQVFAVALAVFGVLVLTIGLGAAPWIALILASSFGTYGLIKKYLELGPVISVTGEVLLLLPLALIWLWGVNYAGWTGVTGRTGGYFGHNWRDSLLLAMSGLITAGPLILFSYATKRLALSTVGLIQYLNPSMQFLVAVLLFQETLTIWHVLSFGLIWIALAFYTRAGLRRGK